MNEQEIRADERRKCLEEIKVKLLFNKYNSFHSYARDADDLLNEISKQLEELGEKE